MTCVVGSTDGSRILLAADSAGGHGDEIYTLPARKVFAVGPYLFGVCGSYRLAQVLRYRIELPDPPESDALEPFLVCDFIPVLRRALEKEHVAGCKRGSLGEKTCILLGCRGELWHVRPDYTVLREGPYAAIGSGRLRAYGALHALHAAGVEPAERRLELALGASAAYTSTVRPPWQFIRSE
jgi:ATP-dependent protease HslVU (ClpYQ) peptidase subunit